MESFGPADEVTEVMVELAYDHEDVVNRIARKAIEQKLVFSAENIADLTNLMDEALQKQLVLQSADSFSKDDLDKLIGLVYDGDTDDEPEHDESTEDRKEPLWI